MNFYFGYVYIEYIKLIVELDADVHSSLYVTPSSVSVSGSISGSNQHSSLSHFTTYSC